MAESFPSILDALRTAPTAPGAKCLKEIRLSLIMDSAQMQRLLLKSSHMKYRLTDYSHFSAHSFSAIRAGLTRSSSDFKIISTLQSFSTNKKSGYERESGALGFQFLATVLGAPVVPLLLTSLSILYDLLMDKGDVVRAAAQAALKAILKLCPPESTGIMFRHLEAILDSGKWRSKVGVLDHLKTFVTSARDEVAAELGAILPHVENAMHDTKSEVSEGSSASNISYNPSS